MTSLKTMYILHLAEDNLKLKIVHRSTRVRKTHNLSRPLSSQVRRGNEVKIRFCE